MNKMSNHHLNINLYDHENIITKQILAPESDMIIQNDYGDALIIVDAINGFIIQPPYSSGACLYELADYALKAFYGICIRNNTQEYKLYRGADSENLLLFTYNISDKTFKPTELFKSSIKKSRDTLLLEYIVYGAKHYVD